MRLRVCLLAVSLCAAASAAQAQSLPPPCEGGTVFEDRNGNGRRDPGEPGLAGQRVSDGRRIVLTDAQGRYVLPLSERSSQFLIKPAGYRVAARADSGLPDYWLNVSLSEAPPLRYGGMPQAAPTCRDYALIPQARNARGGDLDVLVFADPQTKSAVDVGYYRRDIVEPLLAQRKGKAPVADLGLSLGDITHDDLSLYPQLNAVTASLGVPWLHAPGNHDLDFDAKRDEDSLLSYRHVFGPDTYAWEEAQANFVVFDDVVYRPGSKPEYIGGLRPEQFEFLEAYLAHADKRRLLVLAMHIPLFDAAPGRETFRHADRERLFGLLREFPHVLVLSGHSHAQRHVYHGGDSGWRGAAPLHEYNVGAACGAFWSGVKDANGLPDTTMSDGTPNGYARLRVRGDAGYALSWHPAPSAGRALDAAAVANDYLRLYAPKTLRQGSYPIRGIYANVFMGRDDSRVEYRIDGGEWKPMRRVEQADPALLAENARDDAATQLRSFDRAPIATPTPHLWSAPPLPTDLPVGEHAIEVRSFDAWQGEQRLGSSYRLIEAAP
ncbi:calcineurin-like phosphoesterase C-terminal domain-containing protein [Lysobacter enzymogenes]|uniref:calcineurin-like phosphoesterase C-terminal domain-containing protein n=1 Tax=Lysobacter enzymogenes TaxID=69 RepID=UPI001A96C23E|nr:calcineurin-like phosphoesterase family protein [Lysobacter enzymogenes]QQP96660.1 calcineurin-like phosphoesterase family protein [Lysobacter enzymogenes]